MKIEWSWWPGALLALWLSVIFTLYLAPSPEKYHAADLLALLLLVPVLVKYRSGLSSLWMSAKPVAPLFILMAYVVLQAWALDVPMDASSRYVAQLLYGFLPYLLCYLVFRHLTHTRTNLVVMAVLVIPGLVHLAFLYLDILLAILHGEVPFMYSRKEGLLEYVKNAPRVGRRYLSLALLHLLGGTLLMVWYVRHRYLKRVAWTLSGICVLSLALLDARAAYASVGIGALLLAWSMGLRQTWQSTQEVFRWHPRWKLAMIAFLVAVAALGYSAGKSRWVAMSYSFEWAVHDVFHSAVPLRERPYVDTVFWSAPLDDVDECYLSERFRCMSDQSAYLRMAWLLEGVRSLLQHPWGIGYSEDYMGRLWGVEGDDRKYQRNDSFLVEHMVSFGWPAVLLYGWLFWGVVSAMRRAKRHRLTTAATIVVCALLLACAGRLLVDVFSEGLWRYLMALMGIYFGLLHAVSWQARKQQGSTCRN